MKKRTISPRAARRHLRDVTDPSKHFYTSDKRVLKNLMDLYGFLRSCDDESFRHHVDGSKNDFADWIRHVITDEELADQADRCVMKEPMQFRVLKRINILVMEATKDLPVNEKAAMILEDAAVPEEHFVTADGRVLRNLWELHVFLKDASQEAFSHHVNEHKNDVADWIMGSVGDKALAEGIRQIADREKMALLVAKRLETLNQLAQPRRSLLESGGERSEPYVLRVVKAVRAVRPVPVSP